jgi:hypothetical protein
VGMWAQPPIYVQKNLSTQVKLQTPAHDAWDQVAQVKILETPAPPIKFSVLIDESTDI